MDRSKLDDITKLATRLVEPAGYECIETEWVGNDRILRLFVDRLTEVEGSKTINLDDCMVASRLLNDAPELDELVAGKYVLEVSSPGVERPLRFPKHFARHIGETIQVKLSDKVADRRQGKGKLVDVAPPGATTDDASITLETEQGPWSFPLAKLQRASIVYDWGH